MGHSLGGAIASKVSYKVMTKERKSYEMIAKHLKGKEGAKMVGIMIIDVCEGSAIDALPHMENIVLSQPKEFSSIQSAISFVYKSGQVRNIESPQVSTPPQMCSAIISTGKEGVVWRTDLMSTKQYWHGKRE